MIRKTLKWMLLTGAVLGGTGFLFFGTAFPSYVGTIATSVRESVVDQIPIELEIKRAENLIQKIDPQVRDCQRDLAQAEVELENLEESIEELEEVVAGQEKKLRRGMALLTGAMGNGEFELAAYGPRRRVQVDLQRTKDAYVNNMAILETKRSLVERQTQAVEAAKQNLFAVHAEREALADQIRSLKTQQKQIEAMVASSDRFDLDSSALSEAKEVIARVRQRLDVAQRMIENDVLFHDGGVAVAVDERDMLAELEELFGPQQGGERAEIEVRTRR